MGQDYLHGYASLESTRLQDQARTLEHLLHADVSYPPGSVVLEAGCGVGAQTVPLARNSPAARITAVEISPVSLAQAQARTAAAGLINASFQQADILALPFAAASFDHAFVCFLLEHLPRPNEALTELRRVLKPGGSVTVIEGDHGSAFFHPDSDAARASIACQVELQRRAGGDALIGRRLRPLLQDAGFDGVLVSPRVVYADASKPGLVDGFIVKTFTPMIAAIRAPAVKAGLITAGRFDAGIAALHRTAEPDGAFCYTFFKAVAYRTP